MSRRSIKTVHGNAVDISDAHGSIDFLFEDDNGVFRRVSLSVENAIEIAKTLEAFAVIHGGKS